MASFLARCWQNHQQKTVFFIFFCIGFFCFFAGLDGEFVHTDNGLIVNGNAIIRSWNDFIEAFTRPEWKEPYGVGGNLRPMIFLSYSFDWWVSGGNPFFFHLVNLLLHICCAYMLYLLFSQFTIHKNLLLLFCLLFLAHPIHEEAVYEVSQGRTDILAAFFMLASTLCFIRAVRSDSLRWVCGSVLLFACSILAKEIGFVTPVLQFVVWAFFLRAGSRTAIKQLVSVFGVTAIYAWWKWHFFGALGMANVPGPGSSIELMTRDEHILMIMTFSKGFFAYLERFFYPVNLSFNDSFILVQSPYEFVFVAYVVVLLVLAFMMLVFRRKNPFIAGGTLFFLGAMAPISHIAPMLHFIGEHMFYIPAMGLTLLLFGIFQYLNRLRPVFSIAMILIIPVFAAINFHRAPIYKNDYNLTKYNHELAPYNPEAAHGYALALYQRREFSSAIRVIETFMEQFTRHTYTGFRPDPYKMWEILISSKLETGKTDAAIEDLYYVFPIFRREELVKLLEKAYFLKFGMHGKAIFERDFHDFMQYLERQSRQPDN